MRGALLTTIAAVLAFTLARPLALVGTIAAVAVVTALLGALLRGARCAVQAADHGKPDRGGNKGCVQMLHGSNLDSGDASS